ncbi:MAG: hypothetical protein AABX30_02245 [Nanoarchaeota archaeon]
MEKRKFVKKNLFELIGLAICAWNISYFGYADYKITKNLIDSAYVTETIVPETPRLSSDKIYSIHPIPGTDRLEINVTPINKNLENK